MVGCVCVCVCVYICTLHLDVIWIGVGMCREGRSVSCNDMSFADVTLFLGEHLFWNMEDLRFAQMFNTNVGVYIWVKSQHWCWLHCWKKVSLLCRLRQSGHSIVSNIAYIHMAPSCKNATCVTIIKHMLSILCSTCSVVKSRQFGGAWIADWVGKTVANGILLKEHLCSNQIKNGNMRVPFKMCFKNFC